MNFAIDYTNMNKYKLIIDKIFISFISKIKTHCNFERERMYIELIEFILVFYIATRQK